MRSTVATPTEHQYTQARDKFKAVLQLAEDLYGVGLVSQVDLYFFPKGKKAGVAKTIRNGTKPYAVGISSEALAIDPYDMITNTIPHEIAHIVMFATKLGKGHDKSWKNCCLTLGGDGKRCHTLELTAAKKHTKYQYSVDDGTVRTVGPKIHRKVQNGNTGYHFTERNRKLYILARNFIRAV